MKQKNDENGIVEIIYEDDIYKTWTVKLILPHINKYLKRIYPDSLMVRGLTDIIVFDRKIRVPTPVEIQKTLINDHGKFANSHFEKEIRKQLEDNVENYSICWQFFDSEYLRYLQSINVSKKTSLDMTWLVRLMKEEKIRVFVIRHDGVVTELTTKDFEFLKDVSVMCPISYSNDERVLVRNKLNIKQNVLFGYNFTQEEIDQFENDFDNRLDSEKSSVNMENYCMKSNNKRCKFFGNISHAVNTLLRINDSLSCTYTAESHKSAIEGVILGIFHQNDYNGNNKYARIQFIDKFNVAQYFPGYLRNKEMWDYCKTKDRVFTMSEFNGIISGTFNYEFIKKQSKTLIDY